jgi:hypothetical protein
MGLEITPHSQHVIEAMRRQPSCLHETIDIPTHTRRPDDRL